MIEIISLIVTIVLGLPTLIIFFKHKKTKLIYLENKQINVQEDLLKNFNELSIKYKEQEITANLIFIKGYIICDGDKDISSKNNYVEIISPQATKWIDFKIISKSKNLTELSSYEDNLATINFDLFKSGEHYEFEGIVEKNTDTKKEDIKLNFFHRIPDITEIETLKAENLKNINNYLLISTLMLFLGLFILSNEFKINQFNIIPYDTITKKEVKSTDIILSKNFYTTLDLLDRETNGIFLLFKPSKNYDILYDEYDLKKFESRIIKKKIFFKKDVTFRNIFFIILSLILW